MLCCPNIMDSTKHLADSLYSHSTFMHSIYISKAHCYQQIHLGCFLAFPEQLQGSVNVNLIDVKGSISIIKVFPGTAWRVYTRSSRREGMGRRKLRAQNRRMVWVGLESSKPATLLYLLSFSLPLLFCFIKPFMEQIQRGTVKQGEGYQHPRPSLCEHRSPTRTWPQEGRARAGNSLPTKELVLFKVTQKKNTIYSILLHISRHTAVTQLHLHPQPSVMFPSSKWLITAVQIYIPFFFLIHMF